MRWEFECGIWKLARMELLAGTRVCAGSGQNVGGALNIPQLVMEPFLNQGVGAWVPVL